MGVIPDCVQHPDRVIVEGAPGHVGLPFLPVGLTMLSMPAARRSSVGSRQETAGRGGIHREDADGTTAWLAVVVVVLIVAYILIATEGVHWVTAALGAPP